jgi:outer membrane assembly lipoprotein YfiO
LPKIFGLGGSQTEAPPTAAELAQQESKASARLSEAQTEENAGNNGKAAKIYLRLAEDYPFTKSAATAQFRAAQLLERETKRERAFEAYQTLITKYPQSAEFSTALERQFSLANDMRQNRGGFLGVTKIGIEQLLEYYQQIIDNGTRSQYAPKSQFAIAELYAERNDLGDSEKSIEAFQKLVDTYPESPEAADAAFKIGNVNYAISQQSRDSTNLNKARDAFESATALYGENPLAQDARTKLQEISDEDAAKAYKTAQFYLKKGQTKSAAIYFNEVLKAPSSPHYVESREQLNTLTADDPKLLDSLGAIKVPDSELVVPAKTVTVTRPDYFGPPPPAERNRRTGPDMKVDEAIAFPPLEEPVLPDRNPSDATGQNLLLPPPTPGTAAPTPAPVTPAPVIEPSPAPEATTNPKP